MSEPTHADEPAPREFTPWSATIYRLCEELIALRETNHRQHKLFETTMARTRDTLQDGFNTFAAETQRAYQQLRQELNGEKRVSLALLQELLELGLDLENVVAARPAGGDADAASRWAESVAVQSRKVQAALQRHGIHPYDAAVGSAYQPALHERVGGRHQEGVELGKVLEQVERGYASQQPEFVLRRPKVIVSE
jgi:molecular chaperone GrpE (heat shock protein)